MRLAAAIVLAHAKDTPVVNSKTQVHNLPVTIEHKRGSLRILHDDSGKQVYRQHMHHDYGYFDKTKGRDGDEVDCFIGPIKNAKEVFIVHMLDKGPVISEHEDEDKCFVGFPSADAAKTAFLLHYPSSFFGGMTVLPVSEFKRKLKTASLPYRHKKIHAGGPGSGPHPGMTRAHEALTKFGYQQIRDNGKGTLTYGKNADKPDHFGYSVSLNPAGFFHTNPSSVTDKNGWSDHIEDIGKHLKELHGSSIRAGVGKCPHCGSKNTVLMPTDFETKKCKDCGKIIET